METNDFFIRRFYDWKSTVLEKLQSLLKYESTRLVKAFIRNTIYEIDACFSSIEKTHNRIF